MLRQALSLTKQGVPFDVAFALAEGGMEPELIAYQVILGEADGGTFSWDRMAWEEQS
jgi:hypothetical protein